jgi:hypothetical protein
VKQKAKRACILVKEVTVFFLAWFGLYFLFENGASFTLGFCCLSVFIFKNNITEIGPEKRRKSFDFSNCYDFLSNLILYNLFLPCFVIPYTGMLVKITKSLVVTQALKMFSASKFYYSFYSTLAIGPSHFPHRLVSPSDPFRICPSIFAFITLRN